ncbi:hypothetical protein ACG3SL_15655 [Sphingomonas sp. CJ20]
MFWRRLETGTHGWREEIAVRAAGAVLLSLCVAAAMWLHRAVTHPPGHAATLIEFAAAALATACLGLGGAFLVEGPGLFRLIPIPGRHWS